MLLAAGNELLDPHAPGRLDLLPGRETPDALGFLALGRGEIVAKL
jgi:hypothetical protein